MLEPGKKLKQRYVIQRVLSRGLLSNVYAAEDIAIQRRVALKEVISENEQAKTARVEREVALYSRLRHPNILQLLDVLVAEANVFLVFPLIAGPTLAELVRQGPLERSTALGFAREIARTLAFVHQQRVVHRDLKPENIFIEEGRPLLADFGIAKETDEPERLALTRSGQALGTPLYMAPEAIENKAVGPPADVYSLGVVMFELFAGKPPFSGRNFAELVANRMKTPPPPLVQVRPDVPVELSALVQQMLDASPEQRPNASRVAEELDALITAPPVSHPAAMAPPSVVSMPLPTVPTPVAPRPARDTLEFPMRTDGDGGRSPPPAAPVPPPPLPRPTRAPPYPLPRVVPPPRPTSWGNSTLSRTIGQDLNRTVAVSDNKIADHVAERANVESRGFFNDELARQAELQRSREFYRTQLSEDYGNLMFQAKVSFGLWVLFSIVGFIVFVIGIALLYMGRWQEGGATLVSESIVVFIQKLFKDREDEFRERAAKKNRHVELGNLWNLAAQSLDGLDAQTRREKLGKLTDAIIEQVGK